MKKTLALVIMGSGRDLPWAERLVRTLERFEHIEVQLRVGSAHKTPEHLLGLLKQSEADARPKVYYTIAGRSNALSGFVDASVEAPVIGCPPLSSDYAGADIWSSLRMPSGVGPGIVLEPEAAGLFGAKILSLGCPEMRSKIREYQEELRRQVLEADRSLLAPIPG